jgi:hypothetical protein
MRPASETTIPYDEMKLAFIAHKIEDSRYIKNTVARSAPG